MKYNHINVYMHIFNKTTCFVLLKLYFINHDGHVTVCSKVNSLLNCKLYCRLPVTISKFLAYTIIIQVMIFLCVICSNEVEFCNADADGDIDPYDSGIIVSTNPADDSGIDEDVLSEAEGNTETCTHS